MFSWVAFVVQVTVKHSELIQILQFENVPDGLRFCTDNLCGPRRTKTSINKCAWFVCYKTQEKTPKNLSKDMNTKRLLWTRSCCLGNIPMLVGKATWSNLKQSSWNTFPFIIMLQIWFRRGSCELDPVDLSIKIFQLTCQLDQVQKHLFEHLLISLKTFIIMLF